MSNHDQVESDRPEDRADRDPDQGEPKDTDRVAQRTEAPADGGDTGFDADAPGNFVDDEDSPEIPEPNEPG